MLKRVTAYGHRYLRGSGLGSTLVRATLGSGGLRLTGMALSLLVGVQLARGLGVDGYGVYGLAMSVVALLAVPTQFGIPHLLTREVARARVAGDWPQLLGVFRWANRAVVLLVIAVAPLAGATVALLGARLPDGFVPTMACGLVLVAVLGLASIQGATLRGLQRIVLGQVPDLLIRPGAYSLLLFGALAIASPSSLAPWLAMALQALATTAALAVSISCLRSELPSGIEARPLGRHTRQLVAGAIPMGLTEGMRVLQGNLAILVLGLLVSETDAGLFRVSVSAAALIAVPTTLMNIVSTPIVAKLHAEQDPRLATMTTAVAVAMCLGTTALAIPLFTHGGLLLRVAFGAEFEPALYSLQLLSIAQIANAFFGINVTILNMTGHERRATRAFAIALLVDVGAALAIIPQFGATGAALAAIASILVWNVLMWADVRRVHGIDTSVLSVAHLIRRNHLSAK